MTSDTWVRGSDLGPDELRVLGEVTLAILRRLDEARRADGRTAGDEPLVSALIATPLAHVLEEAVEHLSMQVRMERSPAVSGDRRRARSVDLAQLADSLTYAEGLAPEEQEHWARFALILDPACVDALTYLGWRAEAGGDLARAEELYERAIATATARIDPARLPGSHKDDDFWLAVEQRPYMRARAALARLYWRQGRAHDAAAIYRDLVRLAPYDGQGNRYCLVSSLLEVGEHTSARRALDRHCRGEIGAHVLWPRALAVFALEGEETAARQALAVALRENPHVPAYLLDPRPLPWLPEYTSPGSVEEALSYAELGRAGWRRTPGALAWLEREAGQAWTERQETERVLARTTLPMDHRRLTHFRAVRALTELASRSSDEMGILYRQVPAALIARFWRTVIVVGRGCWIWAGSTTMRHKGTHALLEPGLLAHAIVRGRAIPPTALLYPWCGTRGCINPNSHHNVEVLSPDGIMAELAARTGRAQEACRAEVLHALQHTSLEGGLRDSVLPQPAHGGPLVRRELVDRWLEQHAAPGR